MAGATRRETPDLRGATWITWAYAVVTATFVLLTLRREPFDDSYFFKRVALNVLDHGVFAWNVSDGPVYGNTSQLFQAVLVAVTAATRGHTMLATRLLLATCLVGAAALLVHRTYACDRGLAALVAFTSPVALYTALSGMETALAFAMIAAFLAFLYPGRERRPHWLFAPAVVVALWLTRPDAVLLVVPPLIVERWATERRAPFRELLVIAVPIAAFLVLFKLYYGTALPLPFYAKATFFSPYDRHFLELSEQVRRVRFGIFLAVAAPLFLLGAMKRDRVNLTLLASIVAFETYHYATTIEVMGMHGRFYAPALPLLVLAAARAGSDPGVRRDRIVARAALYLALFGALVALRRLPGQGGFFLERVPLPYYFVIVAGALLLFAAPVAERVRDWAPAAMLAGLGCAVVVAHRVESLSPPSDDEYLRIHESHVTVYRGLETVRACFGDAVQVYHTEVGVPGLRFPRGKVSDLAGLLSREWLFRKRTFDDMCLAEKPEAIFLPHKVYAALNEEIRRGTCIEQYERVVRESSSALYIRKDLLERYRACQARWPSLDPQG